MSATILLMAVIFFWRQFLGGDMLSPLDAILETWNRNTTVIINILNNLPEAGIDASDTGGQWTVAHHLADMQSTNVEFLRECAPEFSAGLNVSYRPDASSPLGYIPERDLNTIIAGFQSSADAVARAIRHHVETQTPFNAVYEHPIFFLQHMIWHQAYHVGQIMWALKQSDMRFSNDLAFEMIWKELRR
jgi:uncharacterized damage-inducible protein DinB